MLFSRRLTLGLAMAGALALPALAEGPTEIDLFFPVPVDGKLARDMGTLIKEFNDTHPGIKATAVYTGSYDDTLIKTRAAIKAGKPPSRRDHVGQLPARHADRERTDQSRRLIAADGTTKEQVSRPVLSGVARQRRDRSLGLWRAVPQFDAASLHQRRTRQGSRARSQQATADLGRGDRLGQEADQARRRQGDPLGHRDPLRL